MGSGYNWMEQPQTPFQQKFQSYLGGEVGKEAPAYPGKVGAPMPKGLMDVRGMYSWLLGQGGRGMGGTTTEGFPMPATGAYPGVPMPGIIGKTETGLTEMMETGMPTATKEWEKASKKQFEQMLEDELNRQMAERHAFGGRYSMGAQRAIGETTGRATLGWGTEAAKRRMSAEEAARGRQMGAYGMGAGLGGLIENILMGRLGAAGGLETGVWGMEQEQADREYQEWLRRQPGYRPEFAAAGQWAAQPTGQWAEDPWTAFLSSLVGAGGQVGAAAIGRPGGG